MVPFMEANFLGFKAFFFQSFLQSTFLRAIIDYWTLICNAKFFCPFFLRWTFLTSSFLELSFFLKWNFFWISVFFFVSKLTRIKWVSEFRIEHFYGDDVFEYQSFFLQLIRQGTLLGVILILNQFLLLRLNFSFLYFNFDSGTTVFGL